MEQDAGQDGMSVDRQILIVEDSRVQALKLRHCLERSGYVVQHALDGAAALDLLSSYRPDLVISDVVMQEIDGYALCRRIKADDGLAAIPVALLTSLSEPIDILRGLNAGADDFITKPYDEHFLLSRVRSILNATRPQPDPELEEAIAQYFDSAGNASMRRRKVIDLIMSSYGTVVEQNRELISANAALSEAHDRLESQAEELRALALRDGLTGLSNRRGFFVLSEQLAKLADRRKKSMLMLFLDMDGLKPINDSLGHEEGDRALIAVANLLRETFRRSDVVSRLGGDEFAVLMIDSDDEGFEPVLTRLHNALQSRNANPSQQYVLSFSIGTALYDPSYPRPLEELLRIADTAMYVQKRQKKASTET